MISADPEISRAQAIPLLATCGEMQLKIRSAGKKGEGEPIKDPLTAFRTWLEGGTGI